MQHNKDLSNVRIQKSGESLSEAKALLKAKHFSGSANRSYYCIFHAMRSVLAIEPIDFKKHSAVISHFRKNYIATGKFGKIGERLSDIITDLFEVRDRSDYEDFFVISKQEVIEQVENAEYFLEQVKAYLAKQES